MGKYNLSDRMTEPALPIPEPPPGETWRYAIVGTTVAATPEGQDLIERMRAEGIVVQVGSR